MISAAFVIGLVFAVALALACVALIVVGVVVRRRDLTDDPVIFGRVGVIGGSAMLVVVLGAAAAGFWPYDMDYHRYRHVQGTVDAAQARMLGDGDGGTTQQYAVRLRGDAATYRCDDSRCALLKPGDRLWLWCIREWQYAATSGWACNFDRTEAAT